MLLLSLPPPFLATITASAQLPLSASHLACLPLLHVVCFLLSYLCCFDIY
ncbi:hypothetical protein JB92DRAFT_2881233 [Gautieria morchelliformis]|nr:hypothetical protein JB92DRAFT_2881233 [Gautieria morchelliformis]